METLRILAVLLAGGLPLAGCMGTPSSSWATGAAGPAEWDREVPPGLWRNLGLLRIVDAATGESIPGVRVAVHPGEPERRDNPRGEPSAEGVTDGDGWLLLPDPRSVGDGGEVSFHLDAPSYGSTVTGASDVERTREVRLHRPGTRVVEVRDFSERPVAGVPVVLAGRCGACPLAPHGVTGADGSVRFDGIDPLWIPDVLVGEKGVRDLPYGVLHTGIPGPDPAMEEAKMPDNSEPGRTIVHISPFRPQTARGRILDHEGNPAPGRRVGRFEIDFDRSVQTDADGRFALPGFAGEEGFEAGNVPLVLPPEGFEATIHLPPPGEEPARIPKVEVHVRLAADGPEELLEDVPVWVVSDRDGFTARGAPYNGGDVLAEVPPGPCTVVAGSGLGRFLEARVRAVAAEGGKPVVVRLIAKPTLKVRLEGFPEDGWVHLWTEAGMEDCEATTKAVRTGAIVVPPEGEAVLVLEHDGTAKRFPIPEGRIRGGKETLVLAWPKPKRVRARFVGPDARPAKVRAEVDVEVPAYLSSDVEIPPGCRGSEVEVPTREAGPHFLLVEPEDESLAAVAIPVRILHEDEAVVDLGTVRLRPMSERPRVYLRGPEDPHGRTGSGWFPEAWADVERPGGPDFEIRADDGEEGCARAFLDLRDGDRILLPEVKILDSRGEGKEFEAFPVKWSPPRQVRLDGKGPWSVPWPMASIRLTPVDEAGAPLRSWTCAVDTGSVESKELALEVFGLDAGPHRILIASPDRVSRELRVVLAEGEHRDVAPVLRRRP